MISNEQVGLLSLKDSFLKNEFASVDEFYDNIDHRINSKIAQGMKKAILIIIEEIDIHL